MFVTFLTVHTYARVTPRQKCQGPRSPFKNYSHIWSDLGNWIWVRNFKHHVWCTKFNVAYSHTCVYLWWRYCQLLMFIFCLAQDVQTQNSNGPRDPAATPCIIRC